jgi:uncharacterized protein YukE
LSTGRLVIKQQESRFAWFSNDLTNAELFKCLADDHLQAPSIHRRSGVMVDTIQASPSQLSGTVPTFNGQSNSIADLIKGLNTSTASVVGALSIQPLSGFSSDLESLYGRIGISMNCFTTAMQNIGSSLQAASQGFATTDAQLANVFNTLDQSLKPYMGYDTPAMTLTAPTVHPKPAPPQSNWWDGVGSWISTHAQQAGSWISTHAQQAGSWISDHHSEIIGGVIIGGVVVGSIALAIATGGLSIPFELAAA